MRFSLKLCDAMSRNIDKHFAVARAVRDPIPKTINFDIDDDNYMMI